MNLSRTETRLERRPELDALRGFFLVWMTLTHLPTHCSDLVNSPIGFVSSAEGFVFVSAFLVGRLYIHDAMRDEAGVRRKLWRRSFKIYGYHLAMLALAFTGVAAYAVQTHIAAVYNLLDFYIAHPVTAIIGSALLIYCPPLLDILPMYIVFIFLTPLVVSAAMRIGWRNVLLASGSVWLLAQFGVREFVNYCMMRFTPLHIPLKETGAFNLFAWQALWIVGLWLGARSATRTSAPSRVPGWLGALCCAACAFFIAVRWNWLGPHLTQTALSFQIDKWHIGPLRVVNLVTFSTIVYWLRRFLTPCVSIEPFITLGKASLHVFCTQVGLVVVGLSFMSRQAGQDVGAPPEQLHGPAAAALVAGSFAILILVARRQARKRQAERTRHAVEAVHFG